MVTVQEKSRGRSGRVCPESEDKDSKVGELKCEAGAECCRESLHFHITIPPHVRR